MSYDLNIRGIGTTVSTAGYVTNLQSILVGGSTTQDIERKLGYSIGSLEGGYWLLVLRQGEQIRTRDVTKNREKDDFEFRGYSHFNDGIPKGDTSNVHDQLSTDDTDQETFRKRIDEAAAKLNLGGALRVSKVYPADPKARISYQPGTGVIQYKLTAVKEFDVVAKVGPGQSLKRSMSGEITVL